MKFMPTGGVNANNLKDYLDFKKIIACGGSWMVKKELVAQGKFDEIVNSPLNIIRSNRNMPVCSKVRLFHHFHCSSRKNSAFARFLGL